MIRVGFVCVLLVHGLVNYSAHLDIHGKSWRKEPVSIPLVWPNYLWQALKYPTCNCSTVCWSHTPKVDKSSYEILFFSFCFITFHIFVLVKTWFNFSLEIPIGYCLIQFSIPNTWAENIHKFIVHIFLKCVLCTSAFLTGLYIHLLHINLLMKNHLHCTESENTVHHILFDIHSFKTFSLKSCWS
jgi:hypothetical protein